MIGISVMMFRVKAEPIEIQTEERVIEVKKSPSDHIKEEQINVYDNHVRIDIDDPHWARFTATHSMLPTLDVGTNAIQIKPNSTSQIHIGDIVSYDSAIANQVIIHRVVKIGEDEQGWYALLKGDNNLALDPGKVRFEDVTSLTVGVIY